jgi:hypothetical protein
LEGLYCCIRCIWWYLPIHRINEVKYKIKTNIHDQANIVEIIEHSLDY